MSQTHSVLPYRTDESDLHRLVAARARGRTLEQIRTLGFSAKGFDGVVVSAQCLALIADRDGSLTDTGRRYALASDLERPDMLAQALRSYIPFALALEAALANGGSGPTTLDWLQTWWSAHGYGSSESNRAEAAPVFAKLVEFAGLGRYVQGRKGHSSRIEWFASAAPASGSREPEPRREEEPPRGSNSGVPLTALEVTPPDRATGSPEHPSDVPEQGGTSLRWVVGPGREVVLELPSSLTTDERQRVLRLIELLLGV